MCFTSHVFLLHSGNTHRNPSDSSSRVSTAHDAGQTRGPTLKIEAKDVSPKLWYSSFSLYALSLSAVTFQCHEEHQCYVALIVLGYADGRTKACRPTTFVKL
jgi:hypothetical protein